MEMVSADELRNVGMSALVSALVLASADGQATRAIIGELERSAIARLRAESKLGKAAIATGSPVAHEQDILDTWARWYVDAIGTTTELEVGGASPQTLAAIDAAKRNVQAALETEVRGTLGGGTGR
jgi:hypothetical protein